MAKFETDLLGDFDGVLSYLDRTVMNSGGSVNFVDGSDCTLGETRVAVRVYDRYYFRNSSRASLTLTVVGWQGRIFVSAVGAGGGTGVVFDMDWGAEDDLIRIVRDGLERLGV